MSYTAVLMYDIQFRNKSAPLALMVSLATGPYINMYNSVSAKEYLSS